MTAQPAPDVRPRVLLTGFDRFRDYDDNPSGLLMHELRERLGFDAHEIPTSFARSIQTVAALVEELSPDYVIMFGLAGNRPPGFYLEEVAERDLTTPEPDNDGRPGPAKSPDRPASLTSTLPLDLIEHAIAGAGLPVHRSTDAGGYVCNHIFYEVVDLLRSQGSSASAGFIHLSALATTTDGTATGDDGNRVPIETDGMLTMDDLVAGACAAIAALG